MATLSASITQGCSAGAGLLMLTSASPAPGASSDLTYSWTIIATDGTDYGGTVDITTLPAPSMPLPDGPYAVRVRADENDGSRSYLSSIRNFTVTCAGTGTPGALNLDSSSHTDETALAANDGTATIQASGGTAPLTATIAGPTAQPSQPATSGAPVTFTGLAPGDHTLRITDSRSPVPAFVEATLTVMPYVAPVVGCTDEYADNYDPAASSDTTPSACSYTLRWRSAWQPMAVVVPALPGQQAAYTQANLFIGFRAGHPLAIARPYAAPLALRATVGPDGYATFRLGPYLRAALGTPDGHGGYRLDANSPSLFDSDLYVGYELRRTTGELLEHGYALNAAVPDAQLAVNDTPGAPLLPLSPFAALPIWPGFDTYLVGITTFAQALTNLALTTATTPDEFATVLLPCPSNPLPMMWLAPGGGFGYWVFQGRSALGDNVGDGQAYNEAESGETRWSQRGEARRTIVASSGVFAGADLMEGLRSLWRSPQVWYQPVADGPWVAVTLESGSFPAGRLGVRRQQVSISFTEGAAVPVQGQ